MLNCKDIIVKSQTGSGKTAAFGIPLCEKVIWEESKPQVLVLTPTRELAIQVKEELTNIGRFKRIRAVAVFGKQPFSEQTRELKQKTHIVAGTPGRVFDHIDRGTLDISNIRYLVIDEADEMLNMGFIDQVRDIINKLNVGKNEVYGIGDSIHDVKMLSLAGHKFGIDPKGDFKELVDIVIDDDISDVIKYL